MLAFSKTSVRFLQGMVFVLGAAGPLWASGCGQCAADCVGTLGVQGTVDLDAAAKPTLNLEICHESVCFTETVVFGEEDEATCTKGEFDCTLGEASAGEWRLLVELLQSGAEFEEGTKVTVLVEDATTGETLVDETLTIEDAEENQMCGATCHSADVSWDT